MYDDENEQWEPEFDLNEQTKESDLVIVDEARAPSLQEVRKLQKHHEKPTNKGKTGPSFVRQSEEA